MTKFVKYVRLTPPRLRRLFFDLSQNGIVWMALASMCFATVTLLVKAGGQRLHFFQLVFARSFISFLLILPMMWRWKAPFKLHNKTGMVIRCVCGLTAMACYFYVITKIPVANAAMLFHINPIYIALLSPYLLAEIMPKNFWWPISIAMLGIAMLLKPELNVSLNASMLGLLAGFLSSIGYIYVRKLNRTEPRLTIIFYFTCFAALVSCVLVIPVFVWPQGYEWWWLVGIGVAAHLGQLFMTHAYSLEKAAAVSGATSITLVCTVIGGVLFFGEVPDILSIGGMILIILAVIWISRLRKHLI